jgi:hypothetical protein
MPGVGQRCRRAARVALCGACVAAAAGCELAYPEVVIVNRIDEDVLVRGASFNGCKWEETIAYGEATSPGRCLEGSDRVHFEKLDGHGYCTGQVEDGSAEGLCFCDEDDDPDDDPMDPGLIDEEPTWFNYRTVSVKRVSYGSFHVFELTAGDIEQDFAVPGPYGH